MKLHIFLHLFLFSATITQIHAILAVPITKIESIHQIADSPIPQTTYFFDIDDTLFDSPHMLGSKAWRKYILAATSEEDPLENWHDFLSLFLARNYPLSPVEPNTRQFIQEIQSKGHTVFGLTARERDKWYDTSVPGIDVLTVKQLASLGIHFHPKEDLAPEYYRGVFFADLEPKGEYILKLFQNATQLPHKVIFVDDKHSQVESVASALRQLEIDAECYWYTATEEKAQRFDPLIANIQLYYFWTSGGETILSDNEAAIIGKQHPERDAAYYLATLLHIIRQENLEKPQSGDVFLQMIRND